MIDNKAGGPASGEFTTVIGSDAVFKGELSFEKGVRVDGRIEGKITTKGHLTVSQGGKLQADVVAASIVVEGEVVGNLVASDRVDLRKSAKLQGDVKATKMLVAEGATFIGNCQVGADAAKMATPSSSSSGGASNPGSINRIAETQGPPRK